MKQENFDYLKDLLYRESGLYITQEKIYLLNSRLMPIVRQKNLESVDDLAEASMKSLDQVLVRDIADAMTTNETYFFRDTKPFDLLLKECIPDFVESGVKKIKIFSGACSSGQEPYSIAMTLLENKNLLNGMDFEIIATDISETILEKARKGVYSQFEVQRGVPIKTLMNYFEEKGSEWAIKQEVKDKVTFAPLNLLEDINSMGKFDVVFCRNVLIYFDDKVKRDVLEKVKNIMKPNSFLFLGSAETLLRFPDLFKTKEGIHGIYIFA